MVFLLVVILVINILILFSQKNQKREETNLSGVLVENNDRLNAKLQENNKELLLSFMDFSNKITKAINEDFQGLNNRIETRLDKMNAKVEERLMDGFKETTKTFGNVLERLSKIDEAQKKIETLSMNVISLQDVLTDKKTRGIFGEVQLNQILTSVFGEANSKVYKIQHKLSNGTIADAMLFAPEPMGNICIDSKFPLENFRRMHDKDLSEAEKDVARKDFDRNVRKHIDDISSKYLIKGETSDQAVLFLPAEAIFAEVHAYHPAIIDYAHKKSVLMASPTTLMAVLTMVQAIMKNIERQKYTDIIHEELRRLEEEFTRYETRWTVLTKDIEKITKDVKDITTTSNKISKRFRQISNVNLIEENKTGDEY